MNDNGDRSPDALRQRRIRSFVLRTGRMTDGQQRAFDAQWPRWGLTIAQGRLDPEAVFGRRAPLVLEIGYGMGDSLVAMAQAEPGTDFVGVEVHTPGVGRLLSRIAALGLTNLRSYREDAVEVVEQCLPDACFDRVQIFFPDPWHKKRHHKRRLIQPAFVQSLCRVLKPGGTLHVATDWPNYAQYILEVLEAEAGLKNCAGDEGYVPRPAHRPKTKFEERGERLGHLVWDLLFERRA